MSRLRLILARRCHRPLLVGYRMQTRCPMVRCARAARSAQQINGRRARGTSMCCELCVAANSCKARAHCDGCLPCASIDLAPLPPQAKPMTTARAT